MKYLSILVLVGVAFTPPGAFAQDEGGDAIRDHALDQLVGQWEYQVCREDGECDSVTRTYEASEQDGLYRYTEQFGGEESEGFVGYDSENNGFVEYDYPAEWDNAEFEHRYRSEDASIDLFGQYEVGRPSSRMLEWRINEDGDTMYIRGLGSEISDTPGELLGVIFSRVPVVGSDPIIGGEE